MNDRLNISNWIQAAGEDENKIAFEASKSVELVAAEGDGEENKRPTFSIEAYNGGALKVSGFFTPVIVDLNGLKAASRLPILMDHSPSQIVGQADNVTIDDKGVRLSGTVTGDDGPAAQVVVHAKNGFKWQASIGANIDRREFLASGKTEQVNGRNVTGPMIIARQATLREVSFVAVGADDTSSASVAATMEIQAMEFEKWLKAKGFTPTELSDEQREYLHAQYESEQASGGEKPQKTDTDNKPIQASGGQQAGDGGGAEDPQQVIAAQRAEFAAERERIAEIDKLCAKHPEVAAKAIKDGWDQERTKTEVELAELRASRPNHDTAPGLITGEGSKKLDKSQVLEASLVMRTVNASQEDITKWYGEDVANEAISARYNGASLHMVMDQTIAAAGKHYAGSRRSDDYIRACFEAQRDLQAGGFTSLSISGILGNTANKALSAAYTAVQTVWQDICGIRNHGDFKVHTRYRLDTTGAYRKVGGDGELKHIGLDEDSSTNQVDTYGAIVALTRQTMINDDLGAFLQLPTMLGRLSALRKEEAAFVTLLGNAGSFFSAGNNNLETDPGSALSISSLTTAEQAMMDQVDSNGKPILVQPTILLVGSALRNTADNLMSERLIIDGTSSSKQPARNPHAGKYQVRSSTYINNTSITDQNGDAITGQSSTKWWLMANPADRAALGIAFLNGKQTPTLESADTDFATLGMQWRAYDDFGVAFEDEEAAVQNDGA